MDPPTAASRLAILRMYCTGLRLSDGGGLHPSDDGDAAGTVDAYLASLAQRTVGYVGADLAALCREATLAAAHAHPPCRPSPRHLEAAFLSMGTPSMLRGITAQVPVCSWDAIGGLGDVKAKLRQVGCRVCNPRPLPPSPPLTQAPLFEVPPSLAIHA
jgi:SpoVK/Ycf46/Vps4 family AAA+-type ATPase